MKKNLILTGLAIILTVSIFQSCSHNYILPDDEFYFITIPENGAVDVPVNTNIIVKFSSPIDPKLFERNFHLLNAFEMSRIDSTCDMHGHWMTEEMYEHMRNMMDSVAHHGKFIWNDRFTECIFKPDSTLTSNMEYVMHFGVEIMNMMGNRMHMMRSGSGIVYRFKTGR
jgi:hypothetical protein